MTQFYTFYQILQISQNFTISTKNHNFRKISQYQQKITILTKYYTFYQFRQFRQHRLCRQCGQCRLVQTIGTISTYNKALLCPIGQFRNPCDVFNSGLSFTYLSKPSTSPLTISRALFSLPEALTGWLQSLISIRKGSLEVSSLIERTSKLTSFPLLA